MNVDNIILRHYFVDIITFPVSYLTLDQPELESSALPPPSVRYPIPLNLPLPPSLFNTNNDDGIARNLCVLLQDLRRWNPYTPKNLTGDWGKSQYLRSSKLSLRS